MYNEKVMEHFKNPRCAGNIPDADGMATLEEDCGDVFRFYIKVRNNRVAQVRYEITGCPVAIACCSMTALLAEGRSLPEAMSLTNEDVERALGGLPPEKRHCSNMAADTLYLALQDYLHNQDVSKSIAPPQSPGDSWRLLYMKREGRNG